jgi:hypothetical protein
MHENMVMNDELVRAWKGMFLGNNLSVRNLKSNK